MTLPLAFYQLVNSTAADLGLGEADKAKLEAAMMRVFALGMNQAEKIIEDTYREHTKSGNGESH